jgi:hypothetical protein
MFIFDLLLLLCLNPCLLESENKPLLHRLSIFILKTFQLRDSYTNIPILM